MQRIGGNWLAAAAVTMGLSVAAIAAQFGGEKTETSPGKERRPAAKSAKPAKPATPGGAAIAGKVAQPESQLEAALAAPVSLQVDQVPLQDVVDLLRRNLPVPIVWDSKALEEAGINRQRQVSWQLDNLSLQSVLNLVLAEAELDWTLRRDYLLITSPQESQNLLETKVLLCRDLVLSGPNSPGQRGSHPAMPGMGMMGGGMPGMGMGMPSWMPGGMPGMDGGMGMPGGGMAGSMGAMDVGGGQGQGFSSETPERGNLVALIQATIAPESWGDAGGVGSIREYGSGVLVVRQTPRVLREVEQLLRDLRTAVATP